MHLRSLVGGSAEVVGPEATLQGAANAMVSSGTGGLAVVDGRQLVGIITERDILGAVAKGTDPSAEFVRDWMAVDPDVFSPDTEVAEAATWVLEHGYRHMPVMEDGELLGVVSINDLVWALSS